MGIVLKQTIKGSIYSYIGVLIGAINVAILFPLLFSESEVGLINLIIAVSAIGAQVSCLGSNGIISYFFPKFIDKKAHHNHFFSFVFLYSVAGFVLFAVLAYVMSSQFAEAQSGDWRLLFDNVPALLLLAFLMLLFLLLDSFASSTLNATLGFFYKDVIMRVINTVLLLSYYFQVIDFQLFLWLYVLNFAVPVIAVAIHLLKTDDIDFKMPRMEVFKPHLKSMAGIGLFFILNGLSNSLAMYIDKLMIAYYIGLRGTGIYSIANFIGTVVRVPRLAMGKISTPLIAQAIENNDDEALSKMLRLSVISQVLVGFIIFAPIWTNIDIFLSHLPESYTEGKWVVFFISLSFIATCFLGIGINVIQLSKHYKLITWYNLIAGVSIVIFNVVFIPIWGITGAAFATLLSKLILVVLFLVTLYKKFRFRVVYVETILIILAAALVISGVNALPVAHCFNQPIINSGVNIVGRTLLVLASGYAGLYLLGLFRRFKLNTIV